MKLGELKESMNRSNIARKLGLVFMVSTISMAGVTAMGVYGLVKYEEWGHTIQRRSVIKHMIEFQSPIYFPVREEPKKVEPYNIQLTEVKTLSPIEQDVEDLVSSSKNPEIARYVIEKFGVVYGPKFLAIMTAESGLNSNAYHCNTNGSVDLGIVQANSVHIGKSLTIEQAGNWKEAIDWAEKKAAADAKAAGGREKYNFDAWSAYTNNNYQAFYQ